MGLTAVASAPARTSAPPLPSPGMPVKGDARSQLLALAQELLSRIGPVEGFSVLIQSDDKTLQIRLRAGAGQEIRLEPGQPLPAHLKEILGHCDGTPRKARTIARRCGAEYNSHFRAKLSRLVEMDELAHCDAGYYLPPDEDEDEEDDEG